MGIFTKFLNPRKPKQFNYIPIYYDQEKEKREERIKTIKEKYNNPDTQKEYIPNIKGQFKAGYQQKKNIVHKINLRHIVILAVLFTIALLLMDKLPSYY